MIKKKNLGVLVLLQKKEVVERTNKLAPVELSKSYKYPGASFLYIYYISE